MQKKNQNKSKLIKEIILYILVTILVLLLVFAEDIIKLTQKNKINLAQSSETETEIITNEPNAPMLSAGMIPIKWNGESWIITTTKDSKWYDYKNGKPAYIMLNDGTYQSELVQNMEENGQKLAEENVNIPIQPDELGTIFTWIPRFAYNEEGDMTYIKNIGIIEENWTIPDIFADKHAETVPDFLLTGIWLEKDADNECESKITQMNQEESVYGFIKNTMAIQIDQITQNEIEKYVVGVGVHDDPSSEDTSQTVGASIARPQITDITNPNRIILKIIKQSNQTPIKATGFYNEETEKAEIKVTYTQFGIRKILCDNEEIEFQIQKQNRISTVTIEGEHISKGKHVITIIDNQNNKKDILIHKLTIYAFLYSDGTLTFSTSENPETDKELVKAYGDINESEDRPWYNDRESITTVNFKDKIYPKRTRNWFFGCKNLATINNINNLNTVKVTDMTMMFWGCSSLTSLNLSNLNVVNVTSMCFMFNGCSSLTSLNLSNLNTGNVTNMSYMFNGCSSLTNLNLNGFKTNNVTDMQAMFNGCSSLTSITLTSFNTRNVTNMYGMFYGCSSLTSITLTSFNTSNVTDMHSMFYGCSSLKSLYLIGFDTSNVTDMSWLFDGCSSLTSITLTSFDTSNVTDMQSMFSGCSSLTRLDLSSFNTRNVTDMSSMFYNCKKLTTIGVTNKDWITTNADKTLMFYNCGTSSVSNFK